MSFKQPRQWKRLERHPLGGEDYEDLDEEVIQEMAAEIRFNDRKIINNRKVILYQRKVLDGWQLLRACVLAGVRPVFQELPQNYRGDPERYIHVMNDLRRHDTAERRARIAEKRRERVAAARAAGESIRAIAEKEEVSATTIQDDIARSGVHPHTPAYQEGDEKGEETPVVTGRDGKSYPATQTILCRDCRTSGHRPNCAKCRQLNAHKKEDKPLKNGEILFDWKEFYGKWGSLLREVDKVGRAYKFKDTPAAEGLRRQLKEWKEQFKKVYKQFAKTNAPTE